MRHKAHYAVLGLLAVIMSGCTPARQVPEGAPQSDMQTAAELLHAIAGKEWTLQSMMLDGAAYSLSGRMPTLIVEAGGRVSGFGSVNRYSGSVWPGDQGRVKWSEGFVSTRMAGTPEAMRQEDTFLRGLVRTEVLGVNEDRLLLFSADGKTAFVFEALNEQ